MNEARREEDVMKLRLLADWFDGYDRQRGRSYQYPPNDEVQTDLRRIADLIENEENQAMYADEEPVYPAMLKEVNFIERGDMELKLETEVDGKVVVLKMVLRPLELITTEEDDERHGRPL